MARKKKPKQEPPKGPEPEQQQPEPLVNVYASISAVKVKDGDVATLQFTVNVPLGPSMSNLMRAADVMRSGGGYLTLAKAQTEFPLDPPKPPETPMDGEIPTDPFPAWEKLFEASEMPVCACPTGADMPLSEAWPRTAVNAADDGTTTVLVSHVDPCPLESKTISTMDFTQTEDFNRAVVKARGLRPVALPDESAQPDAATEDEKRDADDVSFDDEQPSD